MSLEKRKSNQFKPRLQLYRKMYKCEAILDVTVGACKINSKPSMF